MKIQKSQELQKLKVCIDGRCPEGIDEMKEIGLSPLEKRAIFFSLQSAIKRAKKESEKPEDMDTFA